MEMNPAELHDTARLLVDAFSNATHVWHESAATAPKCQENELVRENFQRLPPAPQLVVRPLLQHRPMLDAALARLRLKAEACRRLADTSEDVVRRTLWLDRADYWDQASKDFCASRTINCAGERSLLCAE